MLPKLWCAGKLGNCPQGLTRFRFTCLYCRWRRGHLGKWTVPPYWIDYTMPWKMQRYVLVNKQNQVLATKTVWHTIKIDPRGHFTMLRCSAIVMMNKVMSRFRWTEKPLMEFCEFAANYPTW